MLENFQLIRVIILMFNSDPSRYIRNILGLKYIDLD